METDSTEIDEAMLEYYKVCMQSFYTTCHRCHRNVTNTTISRRKYGRNRLLLCRQCATELDVMSEAVKSNKYSKDFYLK